MSEPPDAAAFERALASLEELESQVLRLEYLEGLTFAELARRLGISPDTAKTVHLRGLVQLRGMLGTAAWPGYEP